MAKPLAFGALLARTMRDPIAWASALGVGLLGAEQPADWMVSAAARVLGPSVIAARPSLIDGLQGFNAASAVGTWLVLAALTGFVRLPLVAATLTAANERRGKAMPFLVKNLSRALRTRNIAIMVNSAFAFIPASVLFAVQKRDDSSLWPHLGFALLLAMAGSWLAFADRFAMASFDARQDAVAHEAIDAAHNSPHYLDTGKERGGYGVATGADNAVTAAGWVVLGTQTFTIVGLLLALDLVRALVTPFVPVVPAIVTRGVLGALVAIVSAVAWTYRFERRPRD